MIENHDFLPGPLEIIPKLCGVNFYKHFINKAHIDSFLPFQKIYFFKLTYKVMSFIMAFSYKYAIF